MPGLGMTWAISSRSSSALRRSRAAYREAIARDPKNALPWNSLGNLLQDHLQRYAEAETAYREAIARDPKFAWPWNGLGNLLQDHLQRYTRSRDRLPEAIARDPKCMPRALECLGNLYCDHLDRPSDAAEAYDNALRLEPTDDVAHQNRLFLRRDFMGEGTTLAR